MNTTLFKQDLVKASSLEELEKMHALACELRTMVENNLPDEKFIDMIVTYEPFAYLMLLENNFMQMVMTKCREDF